MCGEAIEMCDGLSYDSLSSHLFEHKIDFLARATEAFNVRNLAEGSRLMDLSRDVDKDPWKKRLPSESDDKPVEGDMEYWASHCITKDLSLFGGAVMRRPDILCPMVSRERHGNRNLDFGSHCFQASLLPSDGDAFPG
jgi:hypothetical protein